MTFGKNWSYVWFHLIKFMYATIWPEETYVYVWCLLKEGMYECCVNIADSPSLLIASLPTFPSISLFIAFYFRFWTVVGLFFCSWFHPHPPSCLAPSIPLMFVCTVFLTFPLFFQLKSMYEVLSSSHKQVEEEMRELADKKESVAHWEAQITEIIQWWVDAATWSSHEWIFVDLWTRNHS